MSSHLYGATLMGTRMNAVLDAFDAPVRDLHSVADAKVVFGRTDIEHGDHPLAAFVARLFGFPDAGRVLPTVITIVSDGRAEIWHRRFAGQPILTELEPGSLTRTAIVERFRFGVAFDLDVTEVRGSLRFKVIGMRVCRVPMPRLLWPTLEAKECEEAGGFRFDIDIGLRGIGRLIRYRGWVRARPQGCK
jgi:hypothetical protein